MKITRFVRTNTCFFSSVFFFVFVFVHVLLCVIPHFFTHCPRGISLFLLLLLLLYPRCTHNFGEVCGLLVSVSHIRMKKQQKNHFYMLHALFSHSFSFSFCTQYIIGSGLNRLEMNSDKHFFYPL